MKNLIAVYGSPRKGGNTSILLDYFLEGVGESSYAIERVYLRELSFSHCTECGRCRKSGVCSVQDDIQPMYEKIVNAARMAIACPVFFLGPPALTKAFLDRFQAFWVRRYTLGMNPASEGVEKRGFLLSVGGFKGSEKIFSCNKRIARAAFSAAGYSYSGELFFSGIDHFCEITTVEGVREKAVAAGKDFVS